MSASRPVVHSPRLRTRTSLITAVLTAAALTSACGAGAGGTAEQAATDPIELEGEAGPPSTRGPGVATTSAGGITGALVPPFTLDRTVWFEGFKIKLATATVDAAAKTLEVDGEAENDSPTDRGLNGDVRLEQDGIAVANGHIGTSSTVLAGGRTAARLKVDRLPTTFDPEKATLVLGDAKHQQVRIPLKGGNGLVAGEPLALPVPAEIVAGALHVNIDRMSVRSDDPKDHSQARSDSHYVLLEGTIRFDGNGRAVVTEHVSMIPPKGAAQSAKHLAAIAQEGGSGRFYCMFEMPTPIGGTYTLQVKGLLAYSRPGGHPDRPASAETRITIPAYPTT